MRARAKSDAVAGRKSGGRQAGGAAPEAAAGAHLIPPEVALDPAAAADLLVDFLRRETRKAGFSRLVVGLSGGIDSATAAALGARALGPRRVTAALLPYRTSSPDSRRDALRVARLLRLRIETVDISPLVDGYLRHAGAVSRVRRGNLMARARMIVLYDLSARDRALVLGTSNKTEMLLGYGTLHGDLACALNPLGDLYKSQVRHVALHLGLPGAIVWKTPTADLWAGQSDEGEFGYPYPEIDRLLHLLIDRRATPGDAVAAGFPARMVKRITALVAGSQFKRRPPLIAKLSARTVGIDYRYPRDRAR